MNSNKFILTLLSIVCLGSFTQEHCAQAAIAQACTTSRSLAADGLNAWMSNRYHNSLSNIGMIVNGAFLASLRKVKVFQVKMFAKDLPALSTSKSLSHNLKDKPKGVWVIVMLKESLNQQPLLI
jgi:hypothetical protein